MFWLRTRRTNKTGGDLPVLVRRERLVRTLSDLGVGHPAAQLVIQNARG
jgi:hypothetical protein